MNEQDFGSENPMERPSNKMQSDKLEERRF